MAHRRDRISMIHNPDGPVQGIPKNLLAYKEIPWGSLNPMAAAILARGAENCLHEDLFYAATALARIHKHKRVVLRVLDLWLISNKGLDKYLIPAVNSAFAMVYRGVVPSGPLDFDTTTPIKKFTKLQTELLEVIKTFEEKPGEPFEMSYNQLIKRSGIGRTSVLRIVNFFVTQEVLAVTRQQCQVTGKVSLRNVYRLVK